MTERRRHARTAIGLRVSIDDAHHGPRFYQTRDISDNGMFVLVRDAPLPPLGSMVNVQVQGVINDAPSLRMRVVRSDSEGFGLRLCDGMGYEGTSS